MKTPIKHRDQMVRLSSTRSESYHEYKIKEKAGDALLKFLAYEIYVKRISNKNPKTGNHCVPVDIFISNYILIQAAEDLLHLTPHPEEVEIFEAKEKMIFNEQGIIKKIKKPYANAFEVHLYEIFKKDGFDAAYRFVEETLFSDYILNRVKQRSPDYFES